MSTGFVQFDQNHDRIGHYYLMNVYAPDQRRVVACTTTTGARRAATRQWDAVQMSVDVYDLVYAGGERSFDNTVCPRCALCVSLVAVQTH